MPLLDVVSGHRGGYVVASGSLPASAPPDFFAQLARKAQEGGSRFVLDTSGAALKTTLSEGGVYLVKPSRGELEEYAGSELDEQGLREAAISIVQRGEAEMVAVSMGAEGALLASREGAIRRASPHVKVRSAIGAGDSFLGAMVWALCEGWSREAAFELGIAAGAAAVITPGTQLCRREDIEALYPMPEKAVAGK
jgi:6-phosphofructokinase 2